MSKIDIINADSFEYLKTLPDKSVNLFIIDPPYFINYASWDGKRNNKEFIVFFETLMSIVIDKMVDNGTAWFFMAKDNLFSNKNKNVERGLVNILEDFGHVNLDNWIVWARPKGRESKNKLKSIREEIIHFTKTQNFIWNPIRVLREVICPYVKDGKPRGWFIDEFGKRVRWTGLGNVWHYSSPQWNGILDKQIHSAQKPFLLIERLVLLSSNENDLVIDPFMGSCVTGLVCKYHNRNAICIEKNFEIYNRSKKMFDQNYSKINEKIGGRQLQILWK